MSYACRAIDQFQSGQWLGGWVTAAGIINDRQLGIIIAFSLVIGLIASFLALSLVITLITAVIIIAFPFITLITVPIVVAFPFIALSLVIIIAFPVLTLLALSLAFAFPVSASLLSLAFLVVLSLPSGLILVQK